MTTAAGVVGEAPTPARPSMDAPGPIRPGRDSAVTRGFTHRKPGASEEERIETELYAAANRELQLAQRVNESRPAPATFAALAQAYGVINRGPEAVDAARQAMTMGLGDPAMYSYRIVDAAAVRIACDIMLRFGAAEDAYELLDGRDLPRSLLITFATISSELGHHMRAMDVLEGYDGSLFESFRGFLLASSGAHQKAIHHLRNALREEPNDASAAMNLAVSLWALGSRKKALAAALRATRTDPGRKDLSLNYLELLLRTENYQRAAAEIRSLTSQDVVPDARFFSIQAWTQIGLGETGKAVTLLEKAVSTAEIEHDAALKAEVAANLAVQRLRLGRLTRIKALDTLATLQRENPGNEAVVVCIARVATRTCDAVLLRRAIEAVGAVSDPAREAYLQHQLAWLTGDNEAAATHAAALFDLEPNDIFAASLAMVELGIGLERWQEAEKVADFALKQFEHDPAIINNVAYIFAMVSRAPEAIQLLESCPDTSYAPKATLGLAHLANGDLDVGMRLYRQAAEQAEQEHSRWRSLMTAYQALIVRQLGIDKKIKSEVISALALPPVSLPSDWKDHPDFVRLCNVFTRRGYGWPPAL